MNIHFSQVERKPQVVLYWLAAFAVFTVLMLTLNIDRRVELRLPVPSVFVQVAQTEKSDQPVPIPAPLPPAGQAQATGKAEGVGNATSIVLPQVIAAPLPSVP